MRAVKKKIRNHSLEQKTVTWHTTVGVTLQVWNYPPNLHLGVRVSPLLYAFLWTMLSFSVAEKAATAVAVWHYAVIVALTEYCSSAAPLGLYEAKVQLRCWGADSNCCALWYNEWIYYTLQTLNASRLLLLGSAQFYYSALGTLL